MSEWTSRPRQTPFAGHRKATHRYCEPCGVLHRTERAVGGPDRCAAVEAARAGRRALHEAGPFVVPPKKARERVRLNVESLTGGPK